MRNRSNFKILILFALILFLSVGYAVVSSVSLSITGSTSGETRDLNVSFTGTKTISNPSKGTATVTAGSKTATFTAGNMTLNETITFSYVVENKETDVAASISLSTTGSNSYFTVIAGNTTPTIEPGKTQNVTVTVKMIKTPITSSDSSASFTITISATPTEPCCFDAGMRVLMADGTYKNIEEVEVSDMVMSLDELTGEYVAKRVTATIIRKNSDDLVYVNLSNGVRIGMRAYHPLLTTEGWKSLRPEQAETVMDVGTVQLLNVGDELVGYTDNVTIKSIEQRKDIENHNTYNLTIEDTHNYIVEGVVVHNATTCQ